MVFGIGRQRIGKEAKVRNQTGMTVRLAATLLTAQAALAATITFDDFGVGGSFALAPSTHYQSIGVLFSRDIPIVDIVDHRVDPSFRTNYMAAGCTLPNAMVLGTNFNPDLDINLTFVVPGTTIPANINYFRALFGDGNVGTVLGTLKAFDACGNLLAVVTSNTPPSEAGELVLNVPGIARVKISTDADSSAIDNIVFSAPTPSGGLPLISLQQNGTLTWTNSFTNALFSVVWAPALGACPTNTRWRDSWTDLTHFWTSPGPTTVEVPMFYRVRCWPATVRLGDTFFGEASDQWPSNKVPSYWTMPSQGARTYDGYGDFAGFTRSEEFHFGDSVAGVKTFKLQVRSDFPGNDSDVWTAFDVLGDMRTLKVAIPGAPSPLFEASPAKPPPILVPGTIWMGQGWRLSWSSLGKVWTVVDTNATFGEYSNLLKMYSVGSISNVAINYYQMGTGRVIMHMSDAPSPSGSGWKLREP
jgi:hypothetical protein